ncbi:MAG: hypothetical protein LBJ61_11615 [Deltaproteobacteria bacterium]|jgi:two-component system sensor histidine kinase HydH|nr:hypothetical protein [Deltaproteobacteria bacterium]
MELSIKPKAIDYLSRPARIPNWLKILLVVALVCLAASAFLALNDLDRESRNLERLFLTTGESHIKYTGMALGNKWIDDKAPNGLDSMLLMERDTDVVFIATTDYKGRIRGMATREKDFVSASLGQPEPPEAFHPNWLPKAKTMFFRHGHKAFVVYRPTLWSIMPPIDPNNLPKIGDPPPPWPPDNLDFEHPERAVYVWLGFSMEEFDKATFIVRLNAIIFSLLTLLVILSILFAITWLFKFIHYHALTNEIITRLPLGLVLNNPEGKVVLANQAAQKLAGLSEAEFVGHTLKDLTHDVFPDEKEINGQEVDISFKDAPCLRLSITSGSITGPGGGELGRVVLMADLGELNRLKDALSKQERMARLGGLASGLAHEIRNPLGAIKGLTQHLINKAEDTDEKDALTVILNCVERMARTITDFQAYANPAINTESVELCDFLTNLHEEAKRELEGDNLSMELSLPQSHLYAQADPTQLASALSGIYRNAFQAMKNNPDDKPGLLKVTLKRTGTNRGTILFSDNGPGFGQKQLQTPFVPYFSSSAKSSGLGLAKANNVIQAFRGSVKLGNNPEGGALVTVNLPLEYDGISELRLSNLDLVKFLKDIHAFIRYDPKFKNVNMALELPEKSFNIQGDKDLLTQALTNVYLNAIQATEANPPDRPRNLTVRLNPPNGQAPPDQAQTGQTPLDKAPEDKAQAGPANKSPLDGGLAIVFSDNGPGFDQAQLDNPFVPYYTTKTKGMGLGLSIIRNIIEAHHGEVAISNEPEGGGRVTVTLPYEAPKRASPSPGRPTRRGAPKPGNGGFPDRWS